ncbi:hypothetical protein IE077_001999, partial [Cardiosporidium cionae]
CQGGPNEAIRTRERNIRIPAAFGGDLCETNSLEGTNQAEICKWIPFCDSVDISALRNEKRRPKAEPQQEVVFSSKPELSHIALHQMTNIEEDRHDNDTLSCEIVYTGDSKERAQYNPKSNACTCPKDRAPCTAERAIETKTMWETSIEEICTINSHTLVYAQDFKQFSCGSKTFLPYKKAPDAFSPQKGCDSVDLYLFCSVPLSEMHARISDWFFLFLSVISGVIVGLILVLAVIQFSADVRDALGISEYDKETSDVADRDKDT